MPPTPSAKPEPSWPGKTTRYWDCCKPSCAWPGKFQAKQQLKVCSGDGSVIANGAGVKSACGGGGDGGPGYMCNDQRPFYDAESKTSYLFAAAALLGLSEADWCCACYELLFDEPHNAGRVVVQVTNTGGDLGENQFDLQIPGGGFGIFDSCASSTQNGPPAFPATSSSSWGSRYGGLLASGARDATACSALPAEVRPGCAWFFERFGALDNPTMRFRRVACPAKVVAISGCQRADDDGIAPLAAAAATGPAPSPAATTTLPTYKVATAEAAENAPSAAPAILFP